MTLWIAGKSVVNGDLLMAGKNCELASIGRKSKHLIELEVRLRPGGNDLPGVGTRLVHLPGLRHHAQG